MPSPSSLLHLSRPPSPRLLQGSSTDINHHRTGSQSSGSSSSEMNAIPSSSSGAKYRNLPSEPSSGSLPRRESDFRSSVSKASEEIATTCSNVLGAYADGSVGLAIPRENWQPDTSSALCSYPLCTNQFAPPENRNYFAVYRRRHHCRLCGLLFCGDHTAKRAQVTMITAEGRRITSKERVCDICLPDAGQAVVSDEVATPSLEPTASHRRRASMWSHGTDSTRSSDQLITPYMSNTSDPNAPTSGSALITEPILPGTPAMESPSAMESTTWLPTASSSTSLKQQQNKAIRSITDPGNTSLAPPLFAPEVFQPHREQHVDDKHIHKVTRPSIHHRRTGRDASMWIPEKWGYKRKDFDVAYNRDSDGDSDGEEPQGGLVVDGPIVFRTQARRTTTPITTPDLSRTSSWAH